MAYFCCYMFDWMGCEPKIFWKEKSRLKRIKHGYIIYFFIPLLKLNENKKIKWDAAYWKVDTFRELYSAALMNWKHFSFFSYSLYFESRSRKIFLQKPNRLKSIFSEVPRFIEREAKVDFLLCPLSLFYILFSPPKGILDDKARDLFMERYGIFCRVIICFSIARIKTNGWN